MFTGIVEEVGRVRAVEPLATGRRLVLEAGAALEGLRPGAACRSPAGATFRMGPEMKPPDGPLACRRRPESHSATMVGRPDEEPR